MNCASSVNHIIVHTKRDFFDEFFGGPAIRTALINLFGQCTPHDFSLTHKPFPIKYISFKIEGELAMFGVSCGPAGVEWCADEKRQILCELGVPHEPWGHLEGVKEVHINIVESLNRFARVAQFSVPKLSVVAGEGNFAHKAWKARQACFLRHKEQEL